MVRLFLFMMAMAIGMTAGAADEKQESANSDKVAAASDQVFYLQVKVVFGGMTGIYGAVPQELAPMKAVLTQIFNYPSYELSNTIRLSLWGDEEASALVFPGHYIRFIPKGTAQSGRSLKVKAELYEVKDQKEYEAFATLGDIKVSGVKEKSSGERSDRLFPIVSSALILTDANWETIGGVPVRVTSTGRVSGNTLSSSPLGQGTVPGALGQPKYLILAFQLETPRPTP